MNYKKSIAAACAALTLNACATYPGNIQPAYVSPAKYAATKCEQIAAERNRVEPELRVLEEKQRGQANTDTALMTVGLLIFWPAMIAPAFGQKHNAEIARLKGEVKALDEAARANGCGAGSPPPLPGVTAAAALPANTAPARVAPVTPAAPGGAGKCYTYSKTTGQITGMIDCGV